MLSTGSRARRDIDPRALCRVYFSPLAPDPSSAQAAFPGTEDYSIRIGQLHIFMCGDFPSGYAVRGELLVARRSRLERIKVGVPWSGEQAVFPESNSHFAQLFAARMRHHGIDPDVLLSLPYNPALAAQRAPASVYVFVGKGETGK